jgi:hypothetical protein
MIAGCSGCEASESKRAFNNYEYRLGGPESSFVVRMRLPVPRCVFGLLLLGVAMGATLGAAGTRAAPAAPLTFVTYSHVDPAVGLG